MIGKTVITTNTRINVKALLTEGQRCEMAADELRDTLERYGVQVEVDTSEDPPMIYMVVLAEAEKERMRQLH